MGDWLRLLHGVQLQAADDREPEDVPVLPGKEGIGLDGVNGVNTCHESKYI